MMREFLTGTYIFYKNFAELFTVWGKNPGEWKKKERRNFGIPVHKSFENFRRGSGSHLAIVKPRATLGTCHSVSGVDIFKGL